MSKTFEIKDLGSFMYFLGGEVAHLKKGDYDVTKKYVLDLLKETRMSGCRPAVTLIDPNQKFYDKKEGYTVNTTQYRRLLGKSIYLLHTRLYIAYAVSLVS